MEYQAIPVVFIPSELDSAPVDPNSSIEEIKLNYNESESKRTVETPADHVYNKEIPSDFNLMGNDNLLINANRLGILKNLIKLFEVTKKNDDIVFTVENDGVFYKLKLSILDFKPSNTETSPGKRFSNIQETQCTRNTLNNGVTFDGSLEKNILKDSKIKDLQTISMKHNNKRCSTDESKDAKKLKSILPKGSEKYCKLDIHKNSLTQVLTQKNTTNPNLKVRGNSELNFSNSKMFPKDGKKVKIGNTSLFIANGTNVMKKFDRTRRLGNPVKSNKNPAIKIEDNNKVQESIRTLVRTEWTYTDQENESNLIIEEKAFNCSYCNFLTVDKLLLFDHISKNHDNKPQSGDARLNTDVPLGKDLKVVSSKEFIRKDRVVMAHRFQCDDCPFSSPRYSMLLAHRSNFHEKINFDGNKCGVRGCNFQSQSVSECIKHSNLHKQQKVIKLSSGGRFRVVLKAEPKENLSNKDNYMNHLQLQPGTSSKKSECEYQNANVIDDDDNRMENDGIGKSQVETNENNSGESQKERSLQSTIVSGSCERTVKSNENESLDNSDKKLNQNKIENPPNDLIVNNTN